jgi:hypothetical protein
VVGRLRVGLSFVLSVGLSVRVNDKKSNFEKVSCFNFVTKIKKEMKNRSLTSLHYRSNALLLGF